MSSVGLIYNAYAISLDLRSSHVLEMFSDLLKGCQTLLCNCVVIKVAFGFVMIHTSRYGRSRWDLPLHATGEKSLGLSSDQIPEMYGHATRG